MSETTSTKQITAPGGKKAAKKKRKKGGGLFNLIMLIAIVGVIGAFIWAEMDRRAKKSELEQTAQELQELREASERSGQEVAGRVLERMRKHVDLPTDPEPTVATIVDVEALKEANEFYAPAKNGDHLVITERRAYLYDPDRDLILDVVPVQVNTADNVGEEQPGEGEAPAGEVAGENQEGQPAEGAPAPEGEAPAPDGGANSEPGAQPEQGEAGQANPFN